MTVSRSGSSATTNQESLYARTAHIWAEIAQLQRELATEYHRLRRASISERNEISLRIAELERQIGEKVAEATRERGKGQLASGALQIAGGVTQGAFAVAGASAKGKQKQDRYNAYAQSFGTFGSGSARMAEGGASLSEAEIQAVKAILDEAKALATARRDLSNDMTSYWGERRSATTQDGQALYNRISNTIQRENVV